MMAMIEALRKLIKRMHGPLEVMLVCVRWYAAYPLSLRDIEEMMAERGVLSTTRRFIAGRSRRTCGAQRKMQTSAIGST